MTSASPRTVDPIASERADDPEIEERLDDFVFGLGARVDELQDLEAAGEFSTLAEALSGFAADGREFGYPSLADGADRAMAACREASPDAVRKSLMDLTTLSQRVRAGHRSAA